MKPTHTTFKNVFEAKPYTAKVEPSKMPKILAIGFALFLLLTALSVPVDKFTAWRAEVAQEKEAKAAEERREQESAERAAEQEAREARERGERIARTRKMVSDRIETANKRRYEALSTHRSVVELTESEDPIEANAAKSVLEQLPLAPEHAVMEVSRSDAADSEDDLASGRAPNDMAAIEAFEAETRAITSYSSQLRLIYSQLTRQAEQQLRSDAAAAQRAEREAASAARNEARAAEQAAQRASREAQRQQSSPGRAPVSNW